MLLYWHTLIFLFFSLKCWYPCYGLLVTYSVRFKARVGSLILTWFKCMCYTFPAIHLRCDTCWPSDLFPIPVSRHWWDSKPWPIMPQTNYLLTELCQLGLAYFMLYVTQILPWVFNKISLQRKSGPETVYVRWIKLFVQTIFVEYILKWTMWTNNTNQNPLVPTDL